MKTRRDLRFVSLVLLVTACAAPGQGPLASEISIVPDTSVAEISNPDAEASEDGAVTPAETTPEVSNSACNTTELPSTIGDFTHVGGFEWASAEGADLGLGGIAPDAISIVFASADTGVFDLAGSTPAECRRCVWLEVDQGSPGAGRYLAVGGSLQVDQAPDVGLQVTLTDAVFAEFVDVGFITDRCHQVARVSLQGAAPCEPDCAGKTCGDDGCGGTCGAGCAFTQTCNATQTGCVGAAPNCPWIDLKGLIAPIEPGLVAAETASNSGDSDPDHIQVELRTDAKGEFDLTLNGNDNYATCDQCLLYVEDGGAALFFPYRGRLTVLDDTKIFEDPPEAELDFYDIYLWQVTIDPMTGESRHVGNNRCFRLQNRNVWTF